MKQYNYFKLYGSSSLYFYQEVLLNTFNDILGQQCHEFRNVIQADDEFYSIEELARSLTEDETYPQLYVRPDDIEWLGSVVVNPEFIDSDQAEH